MITTESGEAFVFANVVAKNGKRHGLLQKLSNTVGKSPEDWGGEMIVGDSVFIQVGKEFGTFILKKSPIASFKLVNQE